MSLLDEINALREVLHELISGNFELQKLQVIECSERLDKLIYEYLLKIQEEARILDKK